MKFLQSAQKLEKYGILMYSILRLLECSEYVVL
jgi:hypothetical protein